MKPMALRTNLFSFDPEQLGIAHRVQVGKHYCSTWQALHTMIKEPRTGLPTTGLEEMLAALSKGPVKVNSTPHLEGCNWQILMLNPVPIEALNEALNLWFLGVGRMLRRRIDDYAGTLVVEGLVPVPASDLIKADRVDALAFTVIPWLLGQKLAAKPMQSNRLIKLYQTSDADNHSLLAWDDPIVSRSRIRHTSALHAIELHLVRLHGRPKPYIQLRVKLAQMQPNWETKKKHAWVKNGSSLLRAKLRTQNFGNNNYKSHFQYLNDTALAFTGLPALPAHQQGPIEVASDTRLAYSAPPSSPLIASGAGMLFLDQAIFHLLACIPGTQSLIVEKTDGLVKDHDSAVRSEHITQAAVVISADPELIYRLEAANPTGFSTPNRLGGLRPQIELISLDVADAQSMLAGNHGDQTVTRWLESSVIPQIEMRLQGRPMVAIIETNVREPESDAERNLRYRIRLVLAKHRIATQFVRHTLPKSMRGLGYLDANLENRSLSHTVVNAIRLTGSQTALIPKHRDMPTGSAILSVFIERLHERDKATLLPVIVRSALGSRESQVFWFDPNQELTGVWMNYHDGLLAMHAAARLLSTEQMKHLIEECLAQFDDCAENPLLICLDSKLRTFYDGLRDGPGHELPPIPRGAAVIRLRTDLDVAQMGGSHSLSPDQPRFAGMKMGVFQSLESETVFYYVSPSNALRMTRAQRHATRYDIDRASLREPWQQLGVTEIAIMDKGSFESMKLLAEQVALLCRYSHMWDFQLRLPLPMFLGMQAAADHPVFEFRK